MLKIIDREKDIRARLANEIATLLQRMHNMSLHDFEEIVRRIHFLRFKLRCLRNDKKKSQASEDNML